MCEEARFRTRFHSLTRNRQTFQSRHKTCVFWGCQYNAQVMTKRVRFLVSGQAGEMMVTKGCYTKYSRNAEAFPRRGDPFPPSCVAVPLAPNIAQEKKRKGVRAQHGLRKSCQRVRADFEAVWDTRRHLPRACFPLYPRSVERQRKMT